MSNHYTARQSVRVRGAIKHLEGRGATKQQALANLRKAVQNAVGNNSYRPGPIVFVGGE